MPEAEKELPGPPAWRGIAGYSLAGLFALYAIYRTDVFSRAGCMSGSLWFPGFKEYIFSREPKRRPDRIYFSLGDREAKTRNPILKTVQENTEAIHALFQGQGIDTVFQLNPGNHFVQGIECTVNFKELSPFTTTFAFSLVAFLLSRAWIALTILATSFTLERGVTEKTLR